MNIHAEETAAEPSVRYHLLDELRGLDLISMILYHGMWDILFLFGVWFGQWWYLGWQGAVWQKSIALIFIGLSGFCAPMGHHMLRRGLVVFGGGALVSVVTLLFTPSAKVLFGVLTLLGSALIRTARLAPWLRRIPPVVGLAVSLLLFAFTYSVSTGWLGIGPWKLLLPEPLYANYLTAYLGFYPEGFYSSDYYPLLPWIFWFWAGYFLHFLVGRQRMEPLRRSLCPPLGWLGRHSLLIYLLHQPVLYAVLYVVFLLPQMFG